MQLSELQHRFGGQLLQGDASLQGVSTDTRTLQPGEWYVALRGQNFYGQDFLAQAQAAGALAVVVEHFDVSCALPQWVVDDATLALQQMAKAWSQKNKPLYRIALTGSSGKTTTKEMLASMLGTLGPTLATRGNLNNHLGVPLTLLKLRPEHLYGVFELGANHEGEIDLTSALVEPHAVGITNIGSAHLEGFGSREGIARAKSEIYRHVADGGRAVINIDDDFASYCLAASQHLRQVSVSLQDSKADVFAEDLLVDEQGCYSFVPQVFGQRLARWHLPLMGRHNVLNACMAIGMVSAVQGCDWKKMQAGLQTMPGVPGRMNCYRYQGITLIDDTYNANPVSMKVAIDTLAGLPGRHVLVVGDMAELGEAAVQGHHEVGAWAKMKKIDALYAVGDYAEAYSEGFGPEARVVADKEQLISDLHRELEGVVSILVKGSRSSHMEEVVNILREQGEMS
ncbi:MAG: UDP-N-acetylmuramoyl-tripeptide--D-alanyl-D-alanine ligase [Pseudomonadales bacterium]|nr:UDP-N-acetylmuramoyl-tripeptide--D-alanyl-D-alanine ligase [Pseudomonadales bacterium]